jgi:hypothetical protein
LEQLDKIVEDANSENELDTERSDHNFLLPTEVIENQKMGDKITPRSAENKDQTKISFAHELYFPIQKSQITKT